MVQVVVSRLRDIIVLSRFLWNSDQFCFLPVVKDPCVSGIDITLELSWK